MPSTDPEENTGAASVRTHGRGTHPNSLAVLARHRKPFPAGMSANPGGRPRSYRAELRELIGEHGHKAYAAILAVAEGRMTFKVLAREPGPTEDSMSAALIPLVEKVPTIRERLDAWKFLAEALNGKAIQAIDLHASVETASKVDLSRLSEERLALLETVLGEASTGEVIEGEFSAAAPGLLPEDWNEGENLTGDTSPMLRSESINAEAHVHVCPIDSETAFATDYEWRGS